MGSHVQMPKGMIKRFGFKDDFTWCYSFDNKSISRPAARRLGSIDNFYSDTLEKEINQKIETPFFQVTSRLYQTANPNCFQGINTDDRQVIVQFYSSVFSRFQDLEELYNNAFVHTGSDHDKAFRFFSQKNLDAFFDQCFITLYFNRAGIPFVLPQVGMTSFFCTKSNSLDLMMPVFPDIAILFESPLDPATYQPTVYETNQIDSIRHINKMLANTQRKIGGWVVCPDKNELEQTISGYNSEAETK